MKVLIDGKKIEVLNDVSVIWDEQGEEEDEQLHLVVNCEGIILDRFIDQKDSDDTLSLEGTAGLEVNDLLDMTH